MSGKDITFPLQGEDITSPLQEEGVGRVKISQLLPALFLRQGPIRRQMA